jgi:DNA uptake protein ComE-like DNA-binding protein
MKKTVAVALALVLMSWCLTGELWAQGAKPAPKGKTAATQAGSAAKAKPLDINTASKEDLMKVPGIGEAYSTKIIEGRPYKSKDELVRKKIIPQATYDRIKDQIVAHQPK